jgi:hypothetical protein
LDRVPLKFGQFVAGHDPSSPSAELESSFR